MKKFDTPEIEVAVLTTEEIAGNGMTGNASGGDTGGNYDD